MMNKLLLMAVAPPVSSLARYGRSNTVYAVAGKSSPEGTMAMNALGCFLFGLVGGLAKVQGKSTPA